VDSLFSPVADNKISDSLTASVGVGTKNELMSSNIESTYKLLCQMPPISSPYFDLF
jgi:hypothetical protein